MSRWIVIGFEVHLGKHLDSVLEKLYKKCICLETLGFESLWNASWVDAGGEVGVHSRTVVATVEPGESTLAPFRNLGKSQQVNCRIESFDGNLGGKFGWFGYGLNWQAPSSSRVNWPETSGTGGDFGTSTGGKAALDGVATGLRVSSSRAWELSILGTGGRFAKGKPKYSATCCNGISSWKGMEERYRLIQSECMVV